MSQSSKSSNDEAAEQQQQRELTVSFCSGDEIHFKADDKESDDAAAATMYPDLPSEGMSEGDAKFSSDSEGTTDYEDFGESAEDKDVKMAIDPGESFTEEGPSTSRGSKRLSSSSPDKSTSATKKCTRESAFVSAAEKLAQMAMALKMLVGAMCRQKENEDEDEEDEDDDEDEDEDADEEGGEGGGEGEDEKLEAQPDASQ